MNYRVITMLFLSLYTSINIAQSIYETSFDNCELPLGWTVESSSNSVGWEINNGDYFRNPNYFFADETNQNCFAGALDLKYDNSDGTANVALSDKLISPWINVDGAQNLILEFDCLSGYGNQIRLYYRFEDQSEWTSFNYIVPYGGFLRWNKVNKIIYGAINTDLDDISKPIQIMFEYTDHGFSNWMGVAIDNFKIYETVDNNANLKALAISDILPLGTHDIKAVFNNYGASPIRDLTINWQLDDGPIQTKNINSFYGFPGYEWSSLSPYASFAYANTALNLNFDQAGTYNIKCWISEVGGLKDNDESNNTITKKVTVLSELPVKQYVFEKYSHNTCPPCYETDLFLSDLVKNNENIIPIAIHSAISDPMDYPEARILDIAYSSRTHPGTSINRQFIEMTPDYRFNHWYDNQLDFVSPWWEAAEVKIISKQYDDVDRKLIVELEADFFTDYDGEYRLNLYVLEDSIQAYQSNAPQGNNYRHRHVMRKAIGGVWGQENSIGTDISAGQKFNYTFETNIDDNWNDTQIEIVATIQRYNSNHKREIINASTILLQDPIISNTEETMLSLDTHIFPNPAKHQCTIVINSDIKEELQLTVYDKMGKILLWDTWNTSVSNYKNLDVSSFPSGSYIYRVSNNYKIISTGKLMVTQ